MAEFTYAHATRVLCGGSEKEEGFTQNTQNLERRASDWGRIAMLDKTQDFFQTCDSEGKGYITRTDMRRLHTELPLSSEELENVFDSLDSDRNGYLTLGEFSSGFSDFLHGRRLSKVEEPAPTPTQKAPEALYQTQWDEYDDEEHFSMLLESLGASNVFEDPSEVRSLWVQLKRDEPHLLSNFEEFLARVTYQIKEAQQEKKEMESALMRKAATHDDEIQHLYEEMELQIKNEKDRLILKDSERLQSRSQDLQQKLSSKEQELDQLFQKQRRLEHQCRDLHDEHQESRVENVKLKMTNEELSRELERTSQKLELAQEQMAILQEQASRLQHEREREMYQVTEGLQREKQSLMKQLDLLREMNKHLRDERDISSLKPQNSIKLAARKKRMTSSSLVWTDRKLSSNSEAGLEDMSQWCNRWSSGLPKGHAHHQAPPVGVGRVEVEDTPPEGWPLRRVISIEEDHLPHLLLGEPVPLFHQLSEEEEEEEEEVEEVREDRGVWEGLADLETGSFHPANVSLAAVQSPLPSSAKATAGRGARIKNDMCSLARGQPVGKETRQRGPVEGAVASPDCLFKVILVGNSSVGKTALLRRFCDGQFHSSTSATVGIDYCVRTLNLGDSHVALQLWDTAGQERYRSITTQYFRKADGVVVIYDVTVADSFRSVRPWLANILDAVGDFIPIMLLGNKCDRESEREVQAKDGQHLAEDAQLMFYECSAYTGCNVLEALMHLARVLRDREDRVREKIHSIILVDQPLKKKACCK